MRIAALLLAGLSCAQPNFKVSKLLGRTNNSIQSHQTVQNKFDNTAVTLSFHDDRLIQLGRLNGLDLTRSDWVHKQLEICPEFPNHVFVQYQEKAEPNETFVAIYPRGIGKIHIIRQGNGPSPASRFSSTREATIAIFNTILADERRNSNPKAASPGVTWIKLAVCYANLAGEIPAASADEPNIYNADGLKHVDTEHGRISIVGIQVLGGSGRPADLSIEFNRPGYIRRVTRTEPDSPSHTH